MKYKISEFKYNISHRNVILYHYDFVIKMNILVMFSLIGYLNLLIINNNWKTFYKCNIIIDTFFDQRILLYLICPGEFIISWVVD